MSNLWNLTAVTLLALIGSGLSCSKTCETYGGSNNTCEISKRSVKAAISEVQEILLSFDERLNEELAEEIDRMSFAERQMFRQDLRTMNAATESEYNSLGDITGSDLSQQEIIETVANKITEDFKQKAWYKRLQSLAGSKIAHFIKNVQ